MNVDSKPVVPCVGLAVVSLVMFMVGTAWSGNPHLDPEAALGYLKALEGEWVVQGGKEGPFGWTFGVTSRGGVIVERLKVGTPTEMATVYHLDGGTLVASHFCQLGNQPRLTAVTGDVEGDLHFVCDGAVGGTDSHAELHMHGVHFQKRDDGLRIWMDMLENGEVAFRTSYDLLRAAPAGRSPE